VELQSELVLLTDNNDDTVASAVSAYRPSFALAHHSVTCPRPSEESLRAWFTDGEDGAAPACRGWAPVGAAGLVTCNPVNGHHAPGSVGLPLPGVLVRVSRESGATAPPGVVGALEVKAPNMPWPERWVDTGAVGALDEDGYLTLADG
jgi:acyl-CoA synthetase (AMP-forming)/AMP-acid ligase II